MPILEEMLAHPQLPPGLIERCVDVLKEIMPSERDLIRVVVEIIVELRETEEVEDIDNLLGVVRCACDTALLLLISFSTARRPRRRYICCYGRDQSWRSIY
jgi:condensin complex subunit 3